MAILKRIVLHNFRNYEKLDISFADSTNVFVGENGQGKTNLLEAIYFLSILRSFRCSRVRNLYRWRQSSFLIRAYIEGDDHSTTVGLEYGDKRRLRIDGETISRASDFIGRLYTVAFVPEDIDLIKGSASERRRFLDITLTQLWPDYLLTLQSYDKALRSRNALLRQDRTSWAAIQAFDDVLIEHGAKLVHRRLQFFKEYRSFVNDSAARLLPDGSSFELKYQSIGKLNEDAALDEIAANLRALLDSNRERDQQRGMTHGGPHRDDFQPLLNSKNLSNFGSEGQCRLGAMILKLAKANHLLERKEHEAVILLVDDVIGELDERGRQAFFQAVERADQVFVVCTEYDKLSGITVEKRFHVDAGTVTSD